MRTMKSFKLEDYIFNMLEELAKDDGRSNTNMIEKLIKEAYEKLTNK